MSGLRDWALWTAGAVCVGTFQSMWDGRWLEAVVGFGVMLGCAAVIIYKNGEPQW